MADCKGGGSNAYASGNCTWWVKQQIPSVPSFWHNAAEWLSNAQQCGWPTGKTPQVGAIACWGPGVDPPWGFGHVAVVKGVAGSTFTVSEMNWKGLGVVDTRNVNTSEPNFAGFIYPPGANLLTGSFGSPTAATGPISTGPSIGDQLATSGQQFLAAGQLGAGGVLVIAGVVLLVFLTVGKQLPPARLLRSVAG